MSRRAVSPAIRTMTVDDLDAVVAIEQRVAAEPWSRSLFAGEFTVAAESRHWLVAVDALPDSGVVGFAGAMFVADEAHIMNIAVDPDHHRRGVARTVLARLLLDAGDRGAVTATLEVRPTNREALALYRRFGFERRGSRPRYYRDGSDALILTGPKLFRPDYRRLLHDLAPAAGREGWLS